MARQEILLVDAQLFQTGAWERGMGAYSLALLKAYAARPDALPMAFIFNKHLPFDEQREKKIRETFPDVELHFLKLPTLVGNVDKGRRQTREKLDEFIAHHYRKQKVNYLILSLFTFDYCAAFPTRATKLLLSYDLIPLICWQDLSGFFAPHIYFTHFKTIFEADHIFAISAATKHQLEQGLSIDSDKITNLRGGTIERHLGSLEAKDKPALPSRFVLMPSADLPHKNNVKAVKAFAKFNREFADELSLVITSHFSDDTKELLRSYSENLVFTGSISDEALDYAYKKAEVVMLVSKIEGLGLPLLEGVHYDKPVVASSIEVFEEISKEAFYFCDAERPESIAKALTKAFSKLDWADKQQEYQAVAKAFTWEHSASTLSRFFNREIPASQRPVRAKGKVNILLPHPSTSSGRLGGFAQSLAPAIKQFTHAQYFVSPDSYVDTARRPYFLGALFNVKLINECSPKILRKQRNFYFIDETGGSAEILQRALAFPGVCFVGTHKLHGLLKNTVQAGLMTEALAAELQKRYQDKGIVALLEDAGNVVVNLGRSRSGQARQLVQETIQGVPHE